MAKWSLRVIEGRWVNVGALSLVPSDCPVWECCVPDGDVNYRPLFGAGSRCFEAKAAVIQDPLSLMAELRSPNYNVLIADQVSDAFWFTARYYGHVYAEALDPIHNVEDFWGSPV